MKKLIIMLLILAGTANADVEFVRWYTQWDGDYTEEEIKGYIDFVTFWKIELGTRPDVPDKIVAWYIADVPDGVLNPCAIFYIDSLVDVLPTPQAMERAARGK